MRQRSAVEGTGTIGWAVASLIALCAQGCAYVSTDVPEVTKTISGVPGLEFPGMGAQAGTRVEATSQIDASLGKTDLFDYVTRGEVTRIRLSPKSGVTRLDFVQAIQIRFATQGQLTGQVLGTYKKGSRAIETDGGILLDIEDGFDHTAYLEAEPLLLELTVDAFAPADGWSASMDLQLALESSRRVDL